MTRFIAVWVFLVLLPLYLAVALAIFIEDGVPVFFTQKRVGINYSFFYIFKFRSMKKNTPNVATHLLTNPDQYLLKIGKFIRRTSLDELPQLINILLGTMSIVGPRPALYNQYDLIQLRKECGVDILKPGLTGLAQIYGRDELNNEYKCKFDKEYLENISFSIDIKIIFLTIIRVIKGSGVSH